MKEHGRKKSSKAQTNEGSGTGGISGHLGKLGTSVKGELGMKEAGLSQNTPSWKGPIRILESISFTPECFKGYQSGCAPALLSPALMLVSLFSFSAAS